MSQQNARELVIKRGDGASPEVFSFVCGIKTRSFKMSNASIDTTVPNCDDPSEPIVATARPGRQTIEFSGNGLFDSNAAGKAIADAARTQAININYQVIVPGYGTFEGPFFISDFEWSGDMENPLEFSAKWTPLDASLLTFTAEA
ncbi:phage tail tube protein [Bradyrhizobium sp. STM 3561]|uniref:phage tail tube protein n=1 Tax=Bradyrhizobium sp. STM 3561 TaxID=578923 RepID=UPI00388F6606